MPREIYNTITETRDSLLSIVNASGFLFQLRVEEEIRESDLIRTGRGQFIAREHRWVDKNSGAESFIDLIIERGPKRIVIECKRVTEGNWIFLLPDNCLDVHKTRLLWSQIYQDRNTVSDWYDFTLNSPSPESAFCVVRGHGEKDSPFLERLSGITLRSVESLASEEMEIKRKTHQTGYYVYIPIIVTNAILHVCSFAIEDVDLSTGKLPESKFTITPYIRFRKNLSTTDVHQKHPNSLVESNIKNDRTVFVVNSGNLVDFLENLEIQYTGSWPWGSNI